MEIKCRRKNSSSGDKFSFPVIIQDSDQFEFGSVTSPASPNSPADHLFSNGKLLPHAFPIHTSSNFSYSRSGSRTSSISSKDSWMSSRSNSTNSRSSTSTSARTSISEASERRLSSADCYGSSTAAVTGRKERAVRPALTCQYQYGSSRRWQLIAAVPVLRHQGSRSRKVDGSVLDRKGSKKSDEEPSSKSWFGRRFLKSFVSTCKECHAIKT